MTADELRDTVLALHGPETAVGRTKEALVDQALAGGPARRVEEVAARVEAITPRKHVWIFSTSGTDLTPSPDDDWEARIAACDTSYVRLDALEQGSSKLQFRLQLLDRHSMIYYVKFDHWVLSSFWRKSTPTLKELVSELIRHSVTAAWRPRQGILEIRFDGYSQGLATEATRRLSYSEVAAEAAEKTAQLLGLPLASLSLSTAVERLLDTRSSEVVDVRRSSRTADLGFAADATGDNDTDVATQIARFFKLSRESVRDSLRSAPADSLLLHWKKHSLLTRLTHYDQGPELLFVWRSADRTASAVDDVIQSLLNAYRAVGTPSLATIAAFIRDLTPGRTVRVSDISSHFGADRKTVLRALEAAIQEGAVRRVYRVRTSAILHQYPNGWAPALTDLPASVEDEHGEVIRLDDPSNIEAGYQRQVAP